MWDKNLYSSFFDHNAILTTQALIKVFLENTLEKVGNCSEKVHIFCISVYSIKCQYYGFKLCTKFIDLKYCSHN